MLVVACAATFVVLGTGASAWADPTPSVSPSVSASESADPECDAEVRDFADALGPTGTPPVIEAADHLAGGRGMTVRVRVYGAMPNADIDAQENSDEQRCHWSNSGTRQPDLLVLAISLADRKTGVYFGSRWTALNGSWATIENADINPQLQAGNVSQALVAGLDRIGTALDAVPSETPTDGATPDTDTASSSGGAGSVIGPLLCVGVIVLVTILMVIAIRRSSGGGGGRGGRGGRGGWVAYGGATYVDTSSCSSSNSSCSSGSSSSCSSGSSSSCGGGGSSCGGGGSSSW